MKFSIERGIYWLIWIAGVFYALFSFCKAVQDRSENLDSVDLTDGWAFLHVDFTDGWTFLQQKKDVSDNEWMVFKMFFKRYWIAILLQVVLSQIFLASRMKLLPSFHSIYSILWLTHIIGPYFTVLYLLYIVIMYAAHLTGKKIICYLLALSSLYIIQQENYLKFRESVISTKVEGFLTDVGFAWLIARCLGFTVDRISTGMYSNMKLNDISLIVSYCLYLPSVFVGPLLPYQDFVDQVGIAHKSWKLEKSLNSVWQLVHPIIGYVLLEFLLHYVYSSAIQFYPEIIINFNAWSLCGLGYAMPVLFYLKYFILYGLVIAVARTECIEFPPPPKCISAIHQPSHLWRTFDRGLYIWMLRYLYLPIINKQWTIFRKFIGLATCFIFIFMWHGMDKAIGAWTVLNFFGVVYDKFTSSVLSSNTCRKYEQKFLSISNRRRLQALVATPNFMLMCISCSFFLSNWDIGCLMFTRIFLSGAFLPTAFIMYCGCCVSSDIREIEKNKRH